MSLGDPEGEVRLAEILRLGATGDLSAVPELEWRALHDTHERWIIHGFGGVSEYPSHTVEHNRDDAVRAIVDIYRRCGGIDAQITRLIGMLEPAPEVPSPGWLAGEVLAGLRAVPALTAALHHPVRPIRVGAAQVLSGFAPEELKPALHHDDPAVRVVAVQCRLRGDARLANLPLLSRMAADPAAAVRVAALDRGFRADLMKIPDADVTPWFAQVTALLERGLQDPDAQVRATALEGITWLQPGVDRTPGLRSLRLANAFGYRVPPALLRPFLADTDTDPRVQLLALQAARWHVQELRPEIEALKHSPHPRVATAATKLLA